LFGIAFYELGQAYNKSKAHFEDCVKRSDMAKEKLTDVKNDPTPPKTG
jgi:hypothetical protein